SATILRPSAVASIFVVPLCGAGPGLYLDLATLSFHVPEKLSAARTTVADIAIAISIPTPITRRVRLIFDLSSLGLCRIVAVGSYAVPATGARQINRPRS